MSILITLIQKALAALIAAIMASMPAAEAKEEKPVVKEVPEVVQEVQEPVRYENHLYLNDIDVEVVEIDATSTYQLQQIVDGPCAAAYQYYKALYIGDHDYQAFATLPQVKVGDLMYWKNKKYECYYADDYGYLDYTQHIKLSNGEYLYEQKAIALVTCKTNVDRYIRLFKEV